MSKILIDVPAGSEVTGITSDASDVSAVVRTEGSDELTRVSVTYAPETIDEVEQRFSFTAQDL